MNLWDATLPAVAHTLIFTVPQLDCTEGVKLTRPFASETNEAARLLTMCGSTGGQTPELAQSGAESDVAIVPEIDTPTFGSAFGGDELSTTCITNGWIAWPTSITCPSPLIFRKATLFAGVAWMMNCAHGSDEAHAFTVTLAVRFATRTFTEAEPFTSVVEVSADRVPEPEANV